MSNHTVISRIPETLLSSAEAQQMIPVVVVACVSMLAILGLAGRGLVFSFLRNHPSEPAREAIFFRTHLGVYIVCLVFANFLTAVTGVMEGVWIGESSIKEDKRCTTQATLVVFSDFLVAWFTAVVAVHTFMSLVLRFKTQALATSIVVGCGFVFAGLMAFIPPFIPPSDVGGPLYGNTTFICSIVRVYPTHQFLMHLLPMFLTAIVSTILYSLIFLVLRGTLVMRGGIRLQLGPKNRWSHRVGTDFEEYHQFFVDIAWSMLWYPVAYVALVTPGTMILLLELSGFPVSWSSMVAATCFQQLLGLVNVILIFNTIRVLRPAIAAASIRTGKALDTKLSDVESLGSPEYPNEKARTTYYSTNSSPSLRQLVLTQSRATSVTESINSQNSAESPITIPLPSRQNSLTGRYSPVAHVATQVAIESATPSARAAYIQQPIMTTAEMNAVFDEPIQPRADSPFSYHQRQYSNDSTLSLGLPPPRRTGRRSPVQRSPSIERAPTPMFSPLTPPAPVQTFPSRLRPESLYSLYQQRTPETARFQPSPTRFSRAMETSSDRRPSMTTFGVSRLP